MSEKPLDNPSDANSQSIDLNTLSSLDFGPSWVDGKSGSASGKHTGGYGAGKNERKGKRRPASGGSRDRRPPSSGRGSSNGSARDGGGQRGDTGRLKRQIFISSCSMGLS